MDMYREIWEETSCTCMYYVHGWNKTPSVNCAEF